MLANAQKDPGAGGRARAHVRRAEGPADLLQQAGPAGGGAAGARGHTRQARPFLQEGEELVRSQEEDGGEGQGPRAAREGAEQHSHDRHAQVLTPPSQRLFLLVFKLLFCRATIEGTTLDLSVLETLKASGDMLKQLGATGQGLKAVEDLVSELESSIQSASDITTVLSTGSVSGMVNSMQAVGPGGQIIDEVRTDCKSSFICRLFDRVLGAGRLDARAGGHGG